MERNLYLNILEKEEALSRFLREFQDITPCAEKISVIRARGRRTAEPVFARVSSPSYNACAMDGIAVISARTKGASEEFPVYLELGKDYEEVDTGDLLLQPYDAVIMAEEVVEIQENVVRIIAPVTPFANVRPAGEDIVAGEMVLPSNHVLRGIDIPVLLAAGIQEISVIRRPVAGIIPTGDEMKQCANESGVQPVFPLPDGMIPETNSWMFLNLIEENGGTGKRWPVIPDRPELIRQAVAQAAEECDIVIINAGSSAGREDYTVHVIRELGKVLVHGVAVKPGKPVILGKILGKPVIGLPGYPVSAWLTFMEFAVPILNLYLKQTPYTAEEAEAKITKTVMSGLKYEEYVRVKLGVVDGELIASPLARGAGASMSLVRSDGFCIIPRNSEGVKAHEKVRIRLLRPVEEIKKTLVVVGSHDLILDVINDLMLEQGTGPGLSSTHVGSMSGLIALKKREAHIAPSHLLCEKDGSYNTEAVRELFPDEKMVIIKGVRRRQGFIVKKGNPLGIGGITDITSKIRYINRQKGAGTRVLFDYLLRKNGMKAEQITGYGNEAATHMSVAIAVQKDNADTGMGIYSCAKALGLDFVDVGFEEYDFVTRECWLELPFVRAFLNVLKSSGFRSRLEKLGGYTCEETGEIRYV